MAGLSVAVGVCAVELIPWWSMAIPGGLLVIFVVVARISVRFMTKSLDARYQQIAHGSDESTIFLSVKKPEEPPAKKSESATKDKDAGEPKPGALWDPVPITMPTYVSKPLAPRTVRTIDLSGPPVGSRRPTPGAGHRRRARAREGRSRARTRRRQSRGRLRVAMVKSAC